jgi:hypothetical protein
MLPITLHQARILVPILLFISAFFLGCQFAMLLKNKPGSFAGLFGADFLGGSLGALFMGTLLFPVLGPLYAVLTLAGLKIISYFIGVKKR